MTVLILGDSDHRAPDGARVGRFAAAGTDASEWFAAELDAALVGWRCTLIGSAADVALYRAIAIRAGAESDEIVVVVTTPGSVVVYCAVCGTLGGAECASCGTELLVTEHVSDHHAATLGLP